MQATLRGQWPAGCWQARGAAEEHENFAKNVKLEVENSAQTHGKCMPSACIIRTQVGSDVPVSGRQVASPGSCGGAAEVLLPAGTGDSATGCCSCIGQL